MDNEPISTQFHSKRQIFDSLETEALYIIRTALHATEIKLHSITSRVKELQSLLDKVERYQIKKPFEEIHDIVGLRVICLFVSDIDQIGDVIRDSFQVVSEDNKIEGSEISSFGYMSVHFIVMMKKEYAGPRYDHIANMTFEIQVRTIAMDAWANVSHYLEYKSETDIPSDLRRDFYALSGLFYVADKHFEMFFRSRSDSREQLSEVFASVSPSLHKEINLDSLNAYLLSKFPDRKHYDPKSVSELVSELTEAGYRYIDEIDDAVERASDAFAAYEREKPPSTDARKFGDIGVIRAALTIINDRFQEVRRQRGNLPHEDYGKYKQLLK